MTFVNRHLLIQLEFMVFFNLFEYEMTAAQNARYYSEIKSTHIRKYKRDEEIYTRAVIEVSPRVHQKIRLRFRKSFGDSFGKPFV